MDNPSSVRVRVRRYQDDDAQFLSKIYYNTIHHVNAKDYTIEQLDAWAPLSCLELDKWQKKWSASAPFVAFMGETIVGFVEFEPHGHIDCFYVHHKYQGSGVGSALLRQIEKEARARSLPRIYAEVSITARPFFEAKGFYIVKQQTVTIRGVELINFVMEKELLEL